LFDPCKKPGRFALPGFFISLLRRLD